MILISSHPISALAILLETDLLHAVLPSVETLKFLVTLIG